MNISIPGRLVYDPLAKFGRTMTGGWGDDQTPERLRNLHCRNAGKVDAELQLAGNGRFRRLQVEERQLAIRQYD
jgi:hypothetical protein